MALETELKKNTAALNRLIELLEGGAKVVMAPDAVDVPANDDAPAVEAAPPEPAAADPLAGLTDDAPAEPVKPLKLDDVRPTLVKLAKRAEPVTYNGQSMSGADAARKMIEATGHPITAMPESNLRPLLDEATALLSA